MLKYIYKLQKIIYSNSIIFITIVTSKIRNIIRENIIKLHQWIGNIQHLTILLKIDIMKRIGVFLKINIKLQIKIMNNSISFDAVNHRFTTSYFLFKYQNLLHMQLS